MNENKGTAEGIRQIQCVPQNTLIRQWWANISNMKIRVKNWACKSLKMVTLHLQLWLFFSHFSFLKVNELHFLPFNRDVLSLSFPSEISFSLWRTSRRGRSSPRRGTAGSIRGRGCFWTGSGWAACRSDNRSRLWGRGQHSTNRSEAFYTRQSPQLNQIRPHLKNVPKRIGQHLYVGTCSCSEVIYSQIFHTEHTPGLLSQQHKMVSI